MSKPTLSVVMTNFNHARYLARAIQAAVEQSRPPDEYIIFDDASTDDSARVIEKFADRYKYIVFRKNEHNIGVVRSWMRARELATGEYIYSAAADDRVCPSFFEKAMDMAQRYPSAGVIMGQMVTVDPNGHEIRLDKVDAWEESRFVSPEDFLEDYLVPQIGLVLGVSTIYKKSALDEVGGFRSELGPWCDAFAARAIALKHGACYIAEKCACFTFHPDSYCRRHGRDSAYVFGLANRGANLMRSAEFRDRFPSGHIERWKKQFIDFHIDTQTGRFQDRMDEALDLFREAFPGEEWHCRILRCLLYGFMDVQRRVLGRCMRYALRRFSVLSTVRNRPHS